jgi:hypothetical protein
MRRAANPSGLGACEIDSVVLAIGGKSVPATGIRKTRNVSFANCLNDAWLRYFKTNLTAK